jgi:hypothetical protein
MYRRRWNLCKSKFHLSFSNVEFSFSFNETKKGLPKSLTLEKIGAIIIVDAVDSLAKIIN